MSSHAAPRRTRRAVALLAALLVLATVGCSSGDGDDDTVDLDPLEGIKQATFEAGSARYTGEVVFADGSSGPIDGTSQAEPPAGQVTYPVFADGGPQPVTVVWVDGTVYIQRAVTADGRAISTTLRLESDPPWVRVADQPLISVVFDAYDPFRLLDRLVQLGVAAEPEGTETVGGDELDRYVVDLSERPGSAGGARTVELLADDDQVLRMVRLAGDDTTEYELTDLGVGVSPAVPPEDQIGASEARPSYEPTGPFEVVAQGTSTAGAWQVQRAPGTDGGTCWRLQAESPVDPVAATNPDGITCIEAFDPEADADEQVRVVLDAGSGASFDAVVAVVPPGSTAASMQFTDRTSQTLPVDPAGVVVWVGPKQPLSVVLEVTAPDGTVVSCGPGSVTEFADLERLSESERTSLDRAPWLCLAL